MHAPNTFLAARLYKKEEFYCELDYKEPVLAWQMFYTW